MSKFSRAPERPPATSPREPRYLDARDLEAELLRTFQICHECRMCVGYCGSFPELFARVDRDIDAGKAEGAEALDNEDIKVIGDECWQCKLCYIKCPYTDSDHAKELLDFPRLMARERAYRAARDGIPLVDKILGEPQLVGAMGSGIAAPLANLINENRLLRKVQEKLTGISAEFPLPPLASETFTSWFTKRTATRTAGDAGEVVLFATCYGEYNTPNVAQAAVQVLEHNGFRVRLPGETDDGPAPASPTCCGMPNLDGGDLAGYEAKVRHNVALMHAQVEAGMRIIVIQPTCGYTMKREWAEYVPTPEAKAVAEATLDLMEFMVMLGREKKLNRDFERSLGTVAYHAACHLRAQKIAIPGARVLGVVPDTDVRVIEQCSAVDGTWGMKAAHYETGRRYAAKLVRGVADVEPDLVVTDCGLSARRLEKENGVVVLHPAEALAAAYGIRDLPSSDRPSEVEGG